MATNEAVDEMLIEEARRIGRHATQKQAVTAALQEYVTEATRNSQFVRHNRFR